MASQDGGGHDSCSSAIIVTGVGAAGSYCGVDLGEEPVEVVLEALGGYVEHDPVVAEQSVEASSVPMELLGVVMPESVVLDGDPCTRGQARSTRAMNWPLLGRRPTGSPARECPARTSPYPGFGLLAATPHPPSARSTAPGQPLASRVAVPARRRNSRRARCDRHGPPREHDVDHNATASIDIQPTGEVPAGTRRAGHRASRPDPRVPRRLDLSATWIRMSAQSGRCGWPARTEHVRPVRSRPGGAPP